MSWEPHVFQHRFIPGYEMPEGGMLPGKYKATSHWYRVDLAPRVGEKCTAYIQHVLQAGEHFKTTYDSFEVWQ